MSAEDGDLNMLNMLPTLSKAGHSPFDAVLDIQA